ncbi:MAG: DUF5320 domain-containing protein [bacterium]
MPRQNGTGHMGQGPGTGRGLGICGAGMRNGYGYGGCRRFISPKNELSALEEEEKILEKELEIIREEKAALQAK